MKQVLIVLALGVLGACSGLEPLAEPTEEQIEFESVDLPGRLWDPFMPGLDQGEPITVDARLTLPATDESVPAVIITHGCGGVGSAETGWVRDLTEWGIATLLVDSFSTREVGSICTGSETISVFSPIVDVYRAADQLDENPYIDTTRLAVMGFSFGGRAAIWSSFGRFQDEYEGRTFAGHVAFYPSTCFIELTDEAMGGGQLRIFHGTDDNWTPIDQCERMVERMTSLGSDAAIFAYEGAAHSFDNASLAWSQDHFNPLGVSPRSCTFVEIDGEIIDEDTGRVAGVASTCVEQGVNYAYDNAARDAAAVDLKAFLDSIFSTDDS